MDGLLTQAHVVSSKPRQRTRQFTISLFFQDPMDLTVLDDWMISVLGVSVEPEDLIGFKSSSPAYADVSCVIWRILLLIRSFLQIAFVPAFEAGTLLKLEQDKAVLSKWTAIIAVTHIDQISEKTYELAINGAIQVVQAVMGQARTAEKIAKLYELVEQKIVTPLRQTMTGGKSTLPVLRVAYVLDIPFMHLGGGVYQFGWGSQSKRMDRSTTEADSAMGSRMAQNKVWSANLLRQSGLPAPVHYVVNTKEEALEKAHRLGWPIVVKPTDRDRGEGVTVRIKTEAQLIKAFEEAKALSKAKQVLIEREVPGVCHRLFIANGELLYSVKRLPQSVKGDGQKTVATLIKEANQQEQNTPPWLRSEFFHEDALALEAMAVAGYGLQSVPKAGEWVPLRDIESTRWGGQDEDVTHCIHPDNLDIALRAASLFRLNVVGIDIISADITRPWYENGAIINEVNFAPLLGGADISRTYIPTFFRKFIQGEGRIPVEVVVGNELAMTYAQNRQKKRRLEGARCFLTSHQKTLTEAGTEIILPFQGIFNRCRALLLSREVDSIILVIQTDELLYTGLPIDRISGGVVLPGHLVSSKNPSETVPKHQAANLLSLLKSVLLKGGHIYSKKVDLVEYETNI